MISKQAGPVTLLAYRRDRRSYNPKSVGGVYLRIRLGHYVLEVEIG